MANIEERQAIASIVHYSTANPEASPTDITDPERSRNENCMCNGSVAISVR